MGLETEARQEETGKRWATPTLENIRGVEVPTTMKGRPNGKVKVIIGGPSGEQKIPYQGEDSARGLKDLYRLVQDALSRANKPDVPPDSARRAQLGRSMMNLDNYIKAVYGR